MIRALFALGLACLVAPAAAPEQLERREAVTLFGAGVSDGELRAGPDRGSAWRPVATPKGVLIVFLGGERNGAHAGWYLNYDHRGKDARVMLTAEPGPGCCWNWSEGPRQKRVRDFGYTFACTARPANGPMRGWALTLDGDKLLLVKESGKEVSFQGTIDDLNDGK